MKNQNLIKGGTKKISQNLQCLLRYNLFKNFTKNRVKILKLTDGNSKNILQKFVVKRALVNTEHIQTNSNKFSEVS